MTFAHKKSMLTVMRAILEPFCSVWRMWGCIVR